jgi:hypothetical protein
LRSRTFFAGENTSKARLRGVEQASACHAGDLAGILRQSNAGTNARCRLGFPIPAKLKRLRHADRTHIALKAFAIGVHLRPSLITKCF